MRLGFYCPHCDSRSANTRLVPLSRTVSDLTFRCGNDDCGHVFVVRLEVVRSVHPSAVPHPAVTLPLAAARSSARVAAPTVRRLRPW